MEISESSDRARQEATPPALKHVHGWVGTKDSKVLEVIMGYNGVIEKCRHTCHKEHLHFLARIIFAGLYDVIDKLTLTMKKEVLLVFQQ